MPFGKGLLSRMPGLGPGPACYNLHSPEGFTVEAILMISSVGEFIDLKKALRISEI
jgi:hypothetical protein